MTTILHSKDSKYIVCQTGYTARIADNPIKKFNYTTHEWKHDKNNKNLEFIHYTLDELIEIKNGNHSLINENQGLNKNYYSKLKEFKKNNPIDDMTEQDIIDDFECDYYGLECNCEFEKYRPLFIRDEVWSEKNFRSEKTNEEKYKNGWYVYSKVDLKLYINDIFDVIDILNNNFDYSDGIIMFKNSDSQVTNMLKEYEYNCMYGNPETSLFVDKEKFGITYINIDGESG